MKSIKFLSLSLMQAAGKFCSVVIEMKVRILTPAMIYLIIYCQVQLVPQTIAGGYKTYVLIVSPIIISHVVRTVLQQMIRSLWLVDIPPADITSSLLTTCSVMHTSLSYMAFSRYVTLPFISRYFHFAPIPFTTLYCRADSRYVINQWETVLH